PVTESVEQARNTHECPWLLPASMTPMGSSVEENLVRLATELASEPPDPDAPSYRDIHPYATFRLGVNRPYTKAFLRALRNTFTGRWEAERVARLIAATKGQKWSLIDAEAILRREPMAEVIEETALDLLIHAYLETMI